MYWLKIIVVTSDPAYSFDVWKVPVIIFAMNMDTTCPLVLSAFEKIKSSVHLVNYLSILTVVKKGLVLRF